MKQFLLPLIFLGTAAGLFVVYTDRSYQATKVLAMQSQSYDEALDTSQELRKLRDQLIARRNTFKPENLQKLERMLPNNVDNIRLIIDINSMATRRGLTLKNVKLGEVSESSDTRSALAVGSSGDEVGSVTLDFTVGASYENFLAFLQDIERSLRLIDIEKLTFTVGETTTDYSFSIRTYWLH